ncbi:MAG TPA: hypothetical protein VM305_10630 [Candidatus Limnocylindrales bacterium]|nr:hypothetical protein [Candidatus Limnocylindrales bacterium]
MSRSAAARHLQPHQQEEPLASALQLSRMKKGLAGRQRQRGVKQFHGCPQDDPVTAT